MSGSVIESSGLNCLESDALAHRNLGQDSRGGSRNLFGGGQTKVLNGKLRAKPELRARSARVSRAKPKSRARSTRELRAKPKPRVEPE